MDKRCRSCAFYSPSNANTGLHVPMYWLVTALNVGFCQNFAL